jgi:predicted DNA-binding transcriptional regulator YafY
MKVERLLGIITVLLNNDKVKARDLAEKFEVSIRTIRRDIDDICKAGIPIVTFQGGDGGISIADGYKLDKSILTSQELENILIGLKGIESISENNNIKLLLEKFSPKNEDVISVNNNIFIDLASFYKTSLSNKIGLLRKAMNSKNEVVFDYFTSSGMSERQIEPYFITFKWSAWYVFGYCRLREDFRLFKLNRMGTLKLSDMKFMPRDIPGGRTQFDDIFSENEQTAVLLLDRSLEYEVVDNYGTGSYEITQDNRIKLNLQYSNYDFAIKTIQGFGDKVEVLSPDKIIEDLKRNAENILKMYK